MAARQGLVLVSFNKSDLYDGEKVDSGGVERLVDHFDALRATVGIEQIGIRTDLQAFGKYVPEELRRTDALQRVCSEMAARGYSLAEIEQVLTGNFLRVWSRSSGED